MILYFSGTGNSEYVAKRIKEATSDEAINLFDRIKNKDTSALRSEKPWVVVTPTYAWRLPRIVQDHLQKTELNGNKNIYFVMTCGDDIGNAEKYLKVFCKGKNIVYNGCLKVVMPENYIAMFKAPEKQEAFSIIEKAEPVIDRGITFIKEEKPFPKTKPNLSGKFLSAFVNKPFYKFAVKAKKFYVTDECVSCGKCEKVCPLSNIKLADGKPVWGDNCTHCMACICRCPKRAIEYGNHTVGLERYVCPKNK